MFDGLPWYVWILLGPLLAVVGLGAAAASLVVLFAVLGVGGDLALGPLERSERWRRWMRRSALRADRKDLRGGVWAFARLVHEGSPSIARVLAPVVSMRHAEAIACEGERFAIADAPNGEIVWLVYEADERAVVVGERRWASRAWLAEVYASATAHWLGPSPTTTSQGGYRERAAAEVTALAELLGMTMPDTRTGTDAGCVALFDQWNASRPYRLLEPEEHGGTYAEVTRSGSRLVGTIRRAKTESAASFPEHARRVLGE
jgi:hypothetical protein